MNDNDIQGAVLQSHARGDQVLGRDLSQGVDINGLIESVCTHCIELAMQESDGSKSKAAEIVGLKNYQTLNNWMEKRSIK